MPQMAPMWWTLMFLLFCISFIFTIMILYPMKQNKPYNKVKETMNDINKMNWKW